MNNIDISSHLIGNKHRCGKKLSLAHKNALINSRKGKHSSLEHCKRISIALTGKVMPTEVREKIRQTLKAKGIRPKNCTVSRKPWNKGLEGYAKGNKYRLGKLHTEETKRKISLSESGEKHYNWQGGKSFEPYSLGWNKTFKEQIRFRDGYKCQVCGCSEVENGEKLSVHHKDYDKKNIVIDNLISLCRSCHIKTNSNRESWIRFFSAKSEVTNEKH